MAKRAVALTAVLVHATLAPPAEATSVAEPVEPSRPPVPDLDEAVGLALPSLPMPPAEVTPPPVVTPSPVPPPVPRATRPETASSSGRRTGRVARSGDPLARIRSCESGSNYQAVSASGRYRGAYQFDRGTWASVGGSGDPAAAPPAEQDHRARLLIAQRGSSAWPVCSGRN